MKDTNKPMVEEVKGDGLAPVQDPDYVSIPDINRKQSNGSQNFSSLLTPTSLINNKLITESNEPSRRETLFDKKTSRLIDTPQDNLHVRNKSMAPMKTPTKLDLRYKHFFCIMPDTEQTLNDYQKRCTLGIAVKSMDDIEYIEKPMIMLENGIFYACVQVSQLNLQTIGRVKYIYKRLNIKQSSWLEGDKVQKLSRPRNFIQLKYFFDYLQPGKMFTDKFEAQRQTYRLIKCLVKRFKEKNNVSSLIGFIEFSRIEQNKYPIIDWLFENLLMQYRKQEKIVPIILEDIQVYIIEVISAFDLQQLMVHRDIVWQLLGLFMFHELGYFRNLFPVNIPQRVQKGLFNLVIFCPKLGLEFLDYSIVIPNQNQYLSLLLRDEQNHAYVLSSLPKLLNEFSFDESIIIAVGINLINNALTLKNVFNYYITLCLYVKVEHDEQLTQAFAGKAVQFSNLQIKALIDQQVELMVGNQHINKIYGEMVRKSVIENLRTDNQQSRQTFKELVENGVKIIDIDYLQSLISSESKLYIQFQKQAPKVINAWFNLVQGNQISQYKQICSQNLFVLLNHHNSKLTSLVSCLEMVEQQSSLLIQSLPHFWGEQNEQQIYDSLSQTLVEHLLQQNFNQQTFLDELQIYISSNPNITDQMHRSAIQIVLEVLSKIDITVHFIPVVLKSCFTSERIIKNDYLKPVVERVLELCKFSKNDGNPTTVQLLDKSVYLASLKIGVEVQSEKSPYLSYLRTEMSKVIESICDRSIQMKTVQEIRKSKPRRIIEVARYFRPNFQIEFLDSLNSLQETYQLNMEKFAQFLSQTVKTEFFDASLLLQNNLKDIQSGFNNIEAKQLETRSLWSSFNDFKTIDMFYHFRNSKLFDNILLQELSNQNIKSKIIHLSDDYFYSIGNFDQFSLSEIFNKTALQHFENLLQYPESQLSFEKMGRYWRGITKDRIATEIGLVEEFMTQYHNSQLKASEQLISDLNVFSELPIRIKNASNIIKIEAYVTINRVSILEEDEYYKSLQQLISYGNSFTSTLELRELISELQDLQTTLQDLENNKSIDFSVIKILGQTKDLFKVYMVSNGFNIYEFLDQLAGNALFKKTQEFDYIIVHIFHVFSQIEKSQRLLEQYNIGNGSLINQSFMSFLELVSLDFKKHSSVQLFESYLSQIRSAIPHIDRSLTSLVDLEAFNFKSLLIYESLINCEFIRFLRLKDESYITGDESKFVYSFQLPSNQTEAIAAQEEESKGGGELQPNQAQIKIMESHNMLRLQVKVKLLMKSQKLSAIEGMDDQIRKNLENVHEIIKHTEDIKRSLKKASKWCKRLPNKVARAEGNANIVQDLVLFQQKLKYVIDQIKGRHLDYVQKFAFFSWIEEHEGKSLVEAIQMNDKSGVEQVISQLADKQIMQHLMDLQNLEDLQNSDILNVIQSNFLKMIDAQEKYAIKEIPIPTTEFIIKQIKVEDNEQIRQQIINIALKHGRAPSFHDIFFCREHTTYEQLQLFILKAITYPSICGEKVQRAFIVANFEVLKPIVAQKSQDLISASSASGVKFNLYVLNIAEKISNEQSQTLAGIEYMGQYISKHTKIFTSEKPGLGKSSKIAQYCKSMNLFCKEIQICNERKTLSIIKEHREHIKDFQLKGQRKYADVEETKEQKKSEENSLKLALSYNISQPHSIETLNRRLFEILILRVIRDEDSQQMFHIPKWVQIFVEVSMEMLSWFNNSIFSKLGFKTVHITQSQALLDFKITSNKYWADISLALDTLDANKKSNRRLQTTTKLKDFAIDMNKDNLQKRIFTSGFYTAEAFLRFGYQQNELLKYSALFNEQLLNEFLRMSLNLSKNQQIMPGNTDDFRFRCLALILKSCEQIILDVDCLKQEAFNQRRKFDLMSEIQNQNLIFLTQSSSLITILRQQDTYPEMIKSFLQKNSEFLLWSDLKRMNEKEVLNKLIHFCPRNNSNVSEAASILLQLEQSEIVFSGHLFGQFVIVYFWLQSYNLNMLSISCSDIQSLKNVLWVYSQILSIQIEYVRLEKTRAQDPQLKNVKKEIQKIIQARDNTKKGLMICIEEIKICSSVFPSLKELIGVFKDREVIFILLKDEMNPYKSEDPLNEFYREDQIYLDNYQLKDYEMQNHQFVHHFVKSIISQEFKDFHEDIAMVVFKINISKIISTSIIKPQTQRLLILINQLCQHPLFFPSNEIASMIKKQQKQLAYVQTYSKGKLELVLHSMIVALHMTYSCVTKAGKFWDLVREIFNEDRHEAGQSTQFTKEFQSVIQNSYYEQIIEKFQENVSQKLLMLQSQQTSAYASNQHIYLTKSCIEIISASVLSILFKRPLLIIGHSGSSKTLCSRLAQESLNSLQAKENLGIKKDRNFRFINFQGTSDLSEDEIQKIINKAEQQKKNNPSVEIIVVIDNFQISHKGQDYAQKLAQLELISKQSSFTMILISSNDELKLDGMLTPNLIQVKLHRIEKSDLLNISRKLFSPKIKYHDILIEQLVAWYYQNIGPNRYRDFYKALSHIEVLAIHSNSIGELTHLIYDTILRNFGDLITQIDKSVLQCLSLTKVPNFGSPDERILKSLTQGGQSRQLMIVENNYQRAINLIVEDCLVKDIQYEIMFEFDSSRKDKLQELVKDLLLKIEEGIFLIVVGITQLIPYLFSILDQQREASPMKKLFNQVSVGSQICQLIVNQNFKCVVIVNEDYYKSMSPQLAGVFETHRLQEQASKTNQRVLAKITNWAKKFKMSQGDINNCFAFPILESNYISDLIQTIDKDGKMEESLLENQCKQSILRVATFTGIMKLDSLQQLEDGKQNPDFENLFESYKNDQSHYSLKKCLDNMSQTWNQDPLFDQNHHGFNIIVHTLQNRLQAGACLSALELPIYLLSWLPDSQILFEYISEFFKSENTSQSFLTFYVDKLDDCFIMKRIQMIQELDRRFRREYTGSVDKNICIIVKIRGENNSITGITRNWKQQTIETLDGDYKSYDTLQILTGDPFQMIQTHTKFLICNKLMTNLIEKVFKHLNYLKQHNDQGINEQRIKIVEKLFKKKSVYKLINQLLHIAFNNDNEKFKIGCDLKNAKPITFQQQLLKFSGTKVMPNAQSEYSLSSIFDREKWPASLSNLVVSSMINPREQIQTNLINYLLKPAFEKHLPTVVFFLEKQNFFNKDYHEKAENKEITLQMHGIIASIFEKEIKTKTSIVTQTSVELDRFQYPCFTGIHELISQHKNYAKQNTRENFKQHILSTYHEFKSIESLNIELFAQDFLEFYLFKGSKKTSLPLSLLQLLNEGKRIDSLTDLYYLFYTVEEFLLEFNSFVSTNYSIQVDYIISCLQPIPQIGMKEELYASAIKAVAEMIFSRQGPTYDTWAAQSQPIKELLQIAKQALGSHQCHKKVPEIKILKFMIKYYNYYRANTQGGESARIQEIFHSSSIELKQNFYGDKLSTLKIINQSLRAGSEESKEKEMIHCQIYYDYLKNFKDQESLMFSIDFFAQFIKGDTLANVSVQSSLQKLLRQLITLHIIPSDLLTRTLDPNLYPNVRDSYLIRDNLVPQEEQESMFQAYPCLHFLDSFISSLSFLSLDSPLFVHIISCLQQKYSVLQVNDPEYQMSARNAIIECFENKDLSLRKVSAVARFKQQICDLGVFDQKDCEFLYCLSNMGSSKQLFNNIFGDVHKVIGEKIAEKREAEKKRDISSVDFESMFN